MHSPGSCDVQLYTVGTFASHVLDTVACVQSCQDISLLLHVSEIRM